MSHVVNEKSSNVEAYKGGVVSIYKSLGFSLDLKVCCSEYKWTTLEWWGLIGMLVEY
jgi:hypothetical protein